MWQPGAVEARNFALRFALAVLAFALALACSGLGARMAFASPAGAPAEDAAETAGTEVSSAAETAATEVSNTADQPGAKPSGGAVEAAADSAATDTQPASQASCKDTPPAPQPEGPAEATSSNAGETPQAPAGSPATEPPAAPSGVYAPSEPNASASSGAPREDATEAPLAPADTPANTGPAASAADPATAATPAPAEATEMDGALRADDASAATRKGEAGVPTTTEPQADASTDATAPLSAEPLATPVRKARQKLAAPAGISGQGANDGESGQTHAYAFYNADDGTLVFCRMARDEWPADLSEGSYWSGFEGATYNIPSEVPWSGCVPQLSSVVFNNLIAPVSTANWFADCVGLQHFDAQGNLDLSNAVSVAGMFQGCTSLQGVNMTGWDVSNVRNVESLLEGCSALQHVDGLEGVARTLTTNASDVAGFSSLRQFAISQLNVPASYFGGSDAENGQSGTGTGDADRSLGQESDSGDDAAGGSASSNSSASKDTTTIRATPPASGLPAAQSQQASAAGAGSSVGKDAEGADDAAERATGADGAAVVYYADRALGRESEPDGALRASRFGNTSAAGASAPGNALFNAGYGAAFANEGEGDGRSVAASDADGAVAPTLDEVARGTAQAVAALSQSVQESCRESLADASLVTRLLMPLRVPANPYAPFIAAIGMLASAALAVAFSLNLR